MKMFRNEKGYSFVEVMVATAILALILPILYSVIKSAQNTYEVGIKKQDLSNVARMTTTRITNDLREAGEIVTGECSDTKLVIKFERPTGNEYKEVIYLDNKNLYLEKKRDDDTLSPGTSKLLLAQNVSSVNFDIQKDRGDYKYVIYEIHFDNGNYTIKNSIFLRNNQE